MCKFKATKVHLFHSKVSQSPQARVDHMCMLAAQCRLISSEIDSLVDPVYLTKLLSVVKTSYERNA